MPKSKPEHKSESIDKSHLGIIPSFLGNLSALKTPDPLVSGTSKIGLGLMLSSEKINKMVGGTLAPTLSGVGGMLAISGMSQLATSTMKSYVSLPLSAVSGYMIGNKSLSPILGSGPLAGIAGATIGLGLGVYSLIEGRNARRKEKQAQARALDYQNREYNKQIEAYQSVLPLMAEEEKLLGQQLKTNSNILELNTKETIRVNSLKNKDTEKLTMHTLGKLKFDLAYAGISGVGSSWFLEGEIKDQEAKRIQEENHELAVNLLRIGYERETLRNKGAAEYRNIAYARKMVEAEIEHSGMILERNLKALRSNRYSSSGQVLRARTSLAAAGALKSSIAGQAKSAEDNYYNMSNWY